MQTLSRAIKEDPDNNIVGMFSGNKSTDTIVFRLTNDESPQQRNVRKQQLESQLKKIEFAESAESNRKRLAKIRARNEKLYSIYKNNVFEVALASGFILMFMLGMGTQFVFSNLHTVDSINTTPQTTVID